MPAVTSHGSVVESLLVPRRDDAECADEIVVSDCIVAVVDGSTGKPWHREGWPSARDVARCVGEVLGQASPEDDFDSLIARASAALAERKRAAGCPVSEGPCATFAAIHLQRREVWRLGDSWVRIGATVYSPPPTGESVVAAARALVLRAALSSGASAAALRERDPGREAIQPLLAALEQLRNRAVPGGYGALDGGPVPGEFRETWRVSAGAEVVLATDGYLEVSAGLAEAERRLRERLDRDPLLIEPPPLTKGLSLGANSFDDRAFVRLVLP